MIQSNFAPLVQKYGGSSLSSVEKVRAVARKLVRSAEGGQSVVAVVSAMGNTTSELIERAQAVASSPPRRELDVLLSSGERMSMALLAMAVEEEGRNAISLTGPQCGIVTNEEHSNAEIVEVRPDRVREELALGNIVIVAGYQGLSTSGEVTTLGRGGSDTTAVALAAALGASRCEIYSDVSGVFTADPRIVPEPRHLRQVDAGLMTEYALHGARVLHPECINLAREYGVAVHALSTFGDDKRTIIAADADMEFSHDADEWPGIVGVTSRKHRVRMLGQPKRGADFEQALIALQEPGELLRCELDRKQDCLLDVEDIPDREDYTGRLKKQLHDIASVTGELASVSIVGAAPIIDEARGQLGAILEGSGIAVASTYFRPLSITCAVLPEARLPLVRALHESLVESPKTVSVA